MVASSGELEYRVVKRIAREIILATQAGVNLSGVIVTIQLGKL
jgi:hypothetical protein